jgi:phosphoglycerate dehydrogenase-like enzyme
VKTQVLVLNNPTQFDPSDESAATPLTDRVDMTWRHLPVVDDAALEQILSAIPAPSILVTSLVPTDQRLLRRLSALEAVIATSTATDYIDLAYCRESGIKVFNTPGYTGPSVAEHAFSLIMAATKHLHRADAGLRGAPQDKVPHAMELRGKRLGIIGLGDIGTRVAGYAACFGMDVVYYNRRPKSCPLAQAVELDTLLAIADVVVLTVPLNRDSHHLIGRRELALMRERAFLVNIGADELIEVDHLVDALRSHRIAGAALDVVSDYQRYLSAPNLLLTRSRGWYTRESVDRRMAGWTATLSGYLEGEYANRIL